MRVRGGSSEPHSINPKSEIASAQRSMGGCRFKRESSEGAVDIVFARFKPEIKK